MQQVWRRNKTQQSGTSACCFPKDEWMAPPHRDDSALHEPRRSWSNLQVGLWAPHSTNLWCTLRFLFWPNSLTLVVFHVFGVLIPGFWVFTACWLSGLRTLASCDTLWNRSTMWFIWVHARFFVWRGGVGNPGFFLWWCVLLLRLCCPPRFFKNFAILAQSSSTTSECTTLTLMKTALEHWKDSVEKYIDDFLNCACCFGGCYGFTRMLWNHRARKAMVENRVFERAFGGFRMLYLNVGEFWLRCPILNQYLIQTLHSRMFVYVADVGASGYGTYKRT